LYYLFQVGNLKWENSFYDIHWFYPLILSIEFIHWFYPLSVSIGFIHWFHLLVLSIDFIHWFYLLLLSIGFIHWFYPLILSIGFLVKKNYIIHWKSYDSLFTFILSFVCCSWTTYFVYFFNCSKTFISILNCLSLCFGHFSKPIVFSFL